MTQDDNERRKQDSETSISKYAEVCKRIGVELDAWTRATWPTPGNGDKRYEGSLRYGAIKRRRLATGVVSRGNDPGMDAPPNIIEVDGGTYSHSALSFEDDLLDYGGKYMGDPKQPEHIDYGELSSSEAYG